MPVTAVEVGGGVGGDAPAAYCCPCSEGDPPNAQVTGVNKCLVMIVFNNILNALFYYSIIC